ncbi:hypothetical protein [Mesorhizobium sp. M4B.F.Ca.ET.017.02.2.1]|uniref:hypothetical protein n=1 Tax=Mesorhizobium sp. M4B.F.Ca.ET.017.02.2.1 TaxID=2496649 RepID=UPI001AED090B|nr:hypothetical protein [Mesorhizobium sp. M4B.F.Ca.ET.017.02.2.1]
MKRFSVRDCGKARNRTAQRFRGTMNRSGDPKPVTIPVSLADFDFTAAIDKLAAVK